MRRLLLALVLFVMSITAHARSFTRGDGLLEPGWWHDPARPGIAFTLAPVGSRLAAAILTFDETGEPVWYLAAGEGADNTWTVPVTRYTWDATTRALGPGTTVGNLTVRVVDSEHVSASWNLPGRTGNATLQALRFSSGFTTEDRSGHWMMPGDAGHGVTLVSERDVDAVVYYAFDGAGQPRWAFGTVSPRADNEVVPMVSFRVDCPTCAPTTRPAGEVSLQFRDEATGIFGADVRWRDGVTWHRQAKALALLSDLPSGRSHKAALARLASDEAAHAYLVEGLARQPSGYGLCYVDFSPPPAEAAQTAVSDTNTQEAGVDEDDLIDADGEYAYSVFVDTTRRAPRGPPISAVRAYRLAPAQADLSLAGSVDLTTDQSDNYSNELRGLYLIGPEQGARALVGVRQEQGDECALVNRRVAIDLLRLEDRGQPRVAHRVRLDGLLVGTRRIGRTIYVVTRYVADVSRYTVNGYTAENIAHAPLEKMLPTVRVDDAPARLMAPADEIWAPPFAPDTRGVVMLTLTAVPIDNPAATTSFVTVSDWSNAMYVSPRSIYLATTRDHVTQGNGGIVFPRETRTDLHYIDLATMKYRASGTVDGHLGGNADQQAFHLSEYDGRLRVLAEGATPFGGSDYYQINVLEPVGDSRMMRVIGRMPNAARPEPIGHPGEQLYSVRFVGDRAYAVTFRATDPLYSIDLSRPDDPRIGGALELPGYSAYLHPLPNGQLLGIGKEAVPATGSADGNFAWYQGLGFSLFDVSNIAAPRRLSAQTLGRRGSGSALLASHHALAYLAPNGSRGARIALPVYVTEATANNPDHPEPSHTYDWVYSGVALYDVEGQQLRARGTLRVTPAANNADTNEKYSALNRGRVLMVGDAVYYWAGGHWYGAPWDAPDRLSPRR